MKTAIGYVLAVFIGLSLGLLGGGGSILAVPILVYVMGVNSKAAIAMSLVIVGTVSLIGVIPYWKQGRVNLKIAVMFTPVAMLGAYLGSRLTALSFITDTFQLICFGIIMAIASIMMIRKSNQPTNLKNTDLAQSTSQPPKNVSLWLGISTVSLGVGIVTGFVGVGGGFLIIPALVLLVGMPMKNAVGTSLLIITANSFAGFLGYINQVAVDWNLIVSFAIAASLGMLLGVYSSKYFDARLLQKGFGYFVLTVAVFVLIKR